MKVMEQKADTSEKVCDSAERGKPRAGTLAKAVELSLYILVIAMTVLFCFTGTEKIFSLSKFKNGLQTSPLIPTWSSWPIAIATITAIYSTSILLMAGFWKPRLMRIGLWIASGLLLAFTLYIVAILTVASHEPCTCIGLYEKLGMGWRAHLLLNGALLSVAWTTTLLSYVHKRFIAINEATPGL